MPNHVYTRMQVHGDAATIKEFAEKHFVDECLSLNSFIPMPEELRDTKAPSDEPNPGLIEKYGYDNWYSWAVNNWGTKWDTYDGSMDKPSENEIVAAFCTAWSLPDPVFHKMGEMYPTLTINMQTVEEGGFFAGTIDIVDGVVSKDLSPDLWKQYAEEILGWYEEDEEEG